MEPAHVCQVPRQRLPDRRGQGRHPILLALALPHDELVAIEVEILDAQIKALLQPDARPIQHHDDQPLRAGQLLQEGADLVPTEHDG
jgi:hypothetical protein